MLQSLRHKSQSDEHEKGGTFDVRGAAGGEVLETSFDTGKDDLVEQMGEGAAKTVVKSVSTIIGIISTVVEQY